MLELVFHLHNRQSLKSQISTYTNILFKILSAYFVFIGGIQGDTVFSVVDSAMSGGGGCGDARLCDQNHHCLH